MSTKNNSREKGELVLRMRGLRMEGQADGEWHEIVKGIDLDLHRGEVVGLIGESGAGKSTIGLASMGFARPGCKITAGSIEFDGTDLMQQSEDYKRNLRGGRISYVAQSAAASFNPAHKLIDQFGEAAVQHGVLTKSEADRDAKDLYRRLELPNPDTIGYRYPHQVSGGQLQRAMVAMAMACKPDLIIFDEPTTALDVTTQIEVLAAVKDIVTTFNTAAIYITHDLAVVAQVADKIMVLRHGNMIELGETRSMIAKPKEDYTRELLAVRTYKKEEFAEANDDAPILKVSNITASYGKGVNVLDNVSMEIHRGHTVAVVGESGSGKSTLARVITGLLPPSAGTDRVRG